VDTFFKLIAAGPLFFASAWLLMLFAGIVSPDVGIRPRSAAVPARRPAAQRRDGE